MRICITHSRKNAFSEAFIRAQIAWLREFTDVCTIHGGRYPERSEDGTLLSPRVYWILHKIAKLLVGRNNYFSDYGVKRFLRQNKVDAVISNFGVSATHMISPCKALRIPLIPVFRGHDATITKNLKQYRLKYKRLFEYASFIVAVSNDLKMKLVDLGADPAKIHVIPSGVDTSKFSQGQPAIHKKQILAVGRFTEKKGPLHTLKAFNKVLKKFPDATLTMVGAKSGLYKQCEQLVNELGINNSVHFTGVQNHDEVAELMRTSYMLVQHSVTAANGDMEGTPGSVMEASASGLPVVSTLHGGIREAVVHGVTGFLVEEKDETGMAEYMIQLFEDPELAREMGLKGRKHMQEHYEQKDQIWMQYVLLSQLLEGKELPVPGRVSRLLQSS